MMLAFSAVITREGRIYGLEVLGNDHDHRQVAPFIDAISRGRLEPARYGADPIAVNLVWFVEHMTVKGKLPRSSAALSLDIRHRRRDVVHRVGRADDHVARRSSSSSVTSNSSRRESGIPSTGNATRHRLASSEYSTRCTADCSSRTTNLIVALRAGAGRRLHLDVRRACCRCRS